MGDRPTRQVPCPRCKGRSLYGPSNRWRPFCSERCASIDLGAWASEAYRVAGAPQADPADPTESARDQPPADPG